MKIIGRKRIYDDFEEYCQEELNSKTYKNKEKFIEQEYPNYND